MIRLDHICNEPDDYSEISEIEPAVKGGQKIVDAILAELTAIS